VTWKSKIIESNNDDFEAVAWTGDLYAAVGGWVGCVYTSEDAVTWIKRNSGTTTNLSDVIWTGKQFVAVGGNSGIIITSQDGISWSSNYTPWMESNLNAIIRNGNQIVIVGDNGSILTSQLDAVAVVQKPALKNADVSSMSTTINGCFVRITSPVFAKDKPVGWTLYSVAGKKIRNGAYMAVHNDLEIPIAFYPPGAYLLKTECNGVGRGFRLVKEQ
jgi:hypothetical protein